MGGKMALVFERGDTGEMRSVTYNQLLGLVKQYAGALRASGVRKSDRVAIYMPMGIEAVAMMLASARIGAIHMVIFAGFSPKAIADRLEMAGVRCVVTQARSTRRGKHIRLKEMMDEALQRLPGERQAETVVVLGGEASHVPMKKDRDISWGDFLKRGKETNQDLVPVESNQPLFLLPTSGTTAKPKITVQNHGGYQRHGEMDL
jgi:acetyl-CoA synthetase